jgi:hypothetical protein
MSGIIATTHGQLPRVFWKGTFDRRDPDTENWQKVEVRIVRAAARASATIKGILIEERSGEDSMGVTRWTELDDIVRVNELLALALLDFETQAANKGDK